MQTSFSTLDKSNFTFLELKGTQTMYLSEGFSLPFLHFVTIVFRSVIHSAGCPSVRNNCKHCFSCCVEGKWTAKMLEAMLISSECFLFGFILLRDAGRNSRNQHCRRKVRRETSFDFILALFHCVLKFYLASLIFMVVG